jgi:hypothetical protein
MKHQQVYLIKCLDSRNTMFPVACPKKWIQIRQSAATNGYLKPCSTTKWRSLPSPLLIHPIRIMSHHAPSCPTATLLSGSYMLVHLTSIAETPFDHSFGGCYEDVSNPWGYIPPKVIQTYHPFYIVLKCIEPFFFGSSHFKKPRFHPHSERRQLDPSWPRQRLGNGSRVLPLEDPSWATLGWSLRRDSSAPSAPAALAPWGPSKGIASLGIPWGTQGESQP